MRLQAEVYCYHCGRLAGTWEWLSTAAPEAGIFQPLGKEERLPARLSRVRCLHCGGPIFLDETTRVAPPLVFAFERPRRGRPPKQDRRLVS